MRFFNMAELNRSVHTFVTFVPMIKVLFAILVGFLWSFGLKRLVKTKVVKWWQQHTTPMYLLFLINLLCELTTFRDELNAPADSQDIAFANGPPATANVSECMATWRQDQRLDEDSLWVGTVASCAPIFVTITFLVTAFATFRHVQSTSTKCLWDQGNRGATIWILQLPVVYSMTALFSVEKGLTQTRIGGYACATGDTRLAFFIEAGLSFGDGYEAIALLLFADITMNVIEHVVDKLVLDAQAVKESLDDTLKKIDVAESVADSVGEELHLVATPLVEVMTRLEKVSEKLVHSTWSLSTLGIQYFAFTCLIVAIPQILACQAVAWGNSAAFSDLSAFSESWAVTFKGMGLLGSCVAIHNMVSIETNFDKAFLEGYTAKLKFISVKIMVSIVFIQEMILPMAFNLSLPRASLFDASLRIIEFTFIAIFNLWAWPLQQEFYKMEAFDIEGMEDLTENLLEGGTIGNLKQSLQAQKKSLQDSRKKVGAKHTIPTEPK